MRTITFFLSSFMAFSLFISCVPGDPEVLSPAERAQERSRNDRNKNKGPSKGPRVQVPNNLEIPMALLIEARHDQALQVLRQSLALVKANAQWSEESCVRMERIEESSSVWTYQLLYKECPMTAGTQKFVFSGSARLAVTMSQPGRISTLSYSTPKLVESSGLPLADESSRPMVYQSIGDSPMVVEDHTEIQMEQTDDGVYRMHHHLGATRISQGSGSSATVFYLPMESTDAVFSIAPSGETRTQYSALINGMGTNSAGGRLPFSLAIEKQASSSNFTYLMVFNEGTPRKGRLELTEESVTLIPEPTSHGPGKKVTKSRQKSGDSLDGIMPWDFWRVNL